DQILWKETGQNFDFSWLRTSGTFWVLSLFAFLYLVTFLVYLAFDQVTPSMPAELTNPAVRGLGTVGACATLVAVALAAANRVSREREQQTLEALLTTPLDSADILFGKWFAAVWTILWPVVGLVILWCFGLITGGLHPAALPLVVAAFIVYVCCLSSMGLWFSMISRTSLRSTLFTLLTSLVMVLGPGLLARAIEGRSLTNRTDVDWGELVVDVGLTPPVTLWTLAFNAHSLRQMPDGMLRIVAAL